MNATPGTPKEKDTAMVWKNDKSIRILFLSFVLFLTLAATGVANAQNSTSSKWSGIKLPTVYQNKLDDFLANNTVMKDNDAKNYTLNFVEKEMESDRWISKENQLLFIRHAIYKQVTDQDLYDWQDWSQKLAEDFSNKAVNIRIRACGQKYRNWIITYMNKLSAEAQQRSAEATNIWLKQITEYYDLCKSNPTAINNEELEETKKYAKHVIQNCKKYWINYRAIILKEVWWDAKKVDEILKFYGVE